VKGAEVSNPASWSPPIPSGAAALGAWRELDRRTRRDLLRATGPHPDPIVACIAVGYARTMLGDRSRHLLRSFLIALSTLLLAMVAAAIAVGMDRPNLAPILSILIIMPVLVTFAIARTRRRLRLIRMENANTPTLLASEMFPPSPEPAPAPGEPVKVAYERGTVLRAYAWTLAVSGASVAAVFFGLGRYLAIPVAALFAVAWVAIGHQLFRWVLPRRPVLVLDGTGVQIRDVLTAPWPAITEIRVLPLRGTNRPDPANRVVVFVCADPEVLLARLTGVRRNGARRALTYYGSPLAVSGRSLDHTVEQIVAAATAFRPVPVRHFAP
jgi:hypothetical protein